MVRPACFLVQAGRFISNAEPYVASTSSRLYRRLAGASAEYGYSLDGSALNPRRVRAPIRRHSCAFKVFLQNTEISGVGEIR